MKNFLILITLFSCLLISHQSNINRQNPERKQEALFKQETTVQVGDKSYLVYQVFYSNQSYVQYSSKGEYQGVQVIKKNSISKNLWNQTIIYDQNTRSLMCSTYKQNKQGIFGCVNTQNGDCFDDCDKKDAKIKITFKSKVTWKSENKLQKDAENQWKKENKNTQEPKAILKQKTTVKVSKNTIVEYQVIFSNDSQVSYDQNGKFKGVYEIKNVSFSKKFWNQTVIYDMNSKNLLCSTYKYNEKGSFGCVNTQNGACFDECENESQNKISFKSEIVQRQGEKSENSRALQKRKTVVKIGKQEYVKYQVAYSNNSFVQYDQDGQIEGIYVTKNVSVSKKYWNQSVLYDTISKGIVCSTFKSDKNGFYGCVNTQNGACFDACKNDQQNKISFKSYITWNAQSIKQMFKRKTVVNVGNEKYIKYQVFYSNESYVQYSQNGQFEGVYVTKSVSVSKKNWNQTILYDTKNRDFMCSTFKQNKDGLFGCVNTQNKTCFESCQTEEQKKISFTSSYIKQADNDKAQKKIWAIYKRNTTVRVGNQTFVKFQVVFSNNSYVQYNQKGQFEGVYVTKKVSVSKKLWNQTIFYDINSKGLMCSTFKQYNSGFFGCVNTKNQTCFESCETEEENKVSFNSSFITKKEESKPQALYKRKTSVKMQNYTFVKFQVIYSNRSYIQYDDKGKFEGVYVTKNVSISKKHWNQTVLYDMNTKSYMCSTFKATKDGYLGCVNNKNYTCFEACENEEEKKISFTSVILKQKDTQKENQKLEKNQALSNKKTINENVEIETIKDDSLVFERKERFLPSP